MTDEDGVDARGFWAGDRLIWQINGEFISDRALRTWVYHNEDGYDRYVGTCITRRHTTAYASRQRSVQ